jgi:hypothetical protein
MSFDAKQIKNLIGLTIDELGYYSDEAVYLLLGTMAVESSFGTYLKQLNGPALGVFQMEPNTLKDIWINYIHHRPNLAYKVDIVSGVHGVDSRALETNLRYQIVMARIHYLRVPKALPNKSDLTAIARYWKVYYNTNKGKGLESKFITSYLHYVQGV